MDTIEMNSYFFISKYTVSKISSSELSMTGLSAPRCDKLFKIKTTNTTTRKMPIKV